ncbi:16S rRNA (guanine(966)-N(2))-methyltransferase RsmD [Staphylospora marina]|uniref:16S rRNA (guanine(966)-N(2))-methyltransferase RsmD n=1 Tax=Staphylospora marina TaxID=2490858 RepID=UPI000F5C0315|nr:16S rRNA (guanine(966)-N(2))-methyltransferase RsmD [Staphylospora marina]
MRIIAGSNRGTRLKMVSGKHVRPTADRVKESVFSVIGPFFDGGWILDLFAGTGQLGLEALSRGADRAVFIDESPASVETVRMNVRAARLEERSEIRRANAWAALRNLKKRGLRFRIIFLDPPFTENYWETALKRIDEYDLLEEDGVIVAEHPARNELPRTVGMLRQYRRLEYGDTAVSLYQRKSRDEQEDE